MMNQLVVAHRGASGLAPENTMLAYQVAYDVGAHMIEIDVQQTVDGKLVCIHDYDVDRTTNGTGEISELTFQEIQELDAGNGEKIPSLDEVLDYVRGRMKINIELKVTEIERDVYSLVHERNMVSDVMISSFLHGTLISARALDRNILTAVLVENLQEDMISYVIDIDANALNPLHEVVSSSIIEEAHVNSIQVFPWTVNDSTQMQTLYRIGVDGVITNFPDVALKVLKIS